MSKMVIISQFLFLLFALSRASNVMKCKPILYHAYNIFLFYKVVSISMCVCALLIFMCSSKLSVVGYQIHHC